MKTLYLLRHAHAEPRGSGLSDFDRALSELGQSEAEAVGKYISSKGISFNYVMCSAALRCLETLEPLRQFNSKGVNEISADYYNISEDKIVEYIRTASDDADTLLYIGHNPGLVFTILKLVKRIPDFITDGIKPATFVAIQLPIDHWSDLDWREGEVIDIYQPNLDSEESPEPMKS